MIIPNHKEKNLEWTYIYCRYFLPYAEIIVSNDFDGRGKGWAAREGFRKSTRNYILLIDGDLDIHPREIKTFMEEIKNADVVVGKKQTSSMPTKRKLISIISRKLIQTLFNLPISDTQTGIKLFKREALLDWETDGFLFDVEILYKAHRNGFKIKEIPVHAVTSKSKSLKDIGKSLCELLTLWYQSLCQHTKA